MKKKAKPSGQFSLWPEEQQAATEEIHEDQPLCLEDLTLFSRSNLDYHGRHDKTRRDWLRKWAQEHAYKDYWFTTHYKYSGYSQGGVPEGKENWEYFLNRAVQYAVWCCFLQVFAPHPLSFYLEDAVKRNEMQATDLDDQLIWRPANQSAPRDAKWLKL